jgi:hypothetical protein
MAEEISNLSVEAKLDKIFGMGNVFGTQGIALLSLKLTQESISNILYTASAISPSHPVPYPTGNDLQWTKGDAATANIPMSTQT